MIAFLLGDWLLQQSPQLPDLHWVWLLPVLLPLLAIRYQSGRIVLSLVIGFLWALLIGQQRLGNRLPATWEGQDLWVEGRIASLPHQGDRSLRFDLASETVTVPGSPPQSWPRRLRLSWYGNVPPLQVGDRWGLAVHLKLPHATLNPGGSDYEKWLFQEGIAALGNVVRYPEPQLMASDQPWLTSPLLAVHRLRQVLADELATVLPNSPQLGLIQGLAIGETGTINPSQWNVLNRTGTIHLLAISGSHIALVAGLVFFIVRFLWARTGRGPLWIPVPRMAAGAALIAAGGYTALAGFPIPAQRALIMVGVAMIGILAGRALRPGRALSLALLTVLLYDPLAVNAAGFWLSFGAVAAMLYGMAWRTRPLRWEWGRLQWLVTIGLLPLLLAIFQRVALYSPLANLVAIPWLELGTVPIVLLGTALLPWAPALAHWPLALADELLAGLWWFLTEVATLPGGLWNPPPPPAWSVAASLVGVLLVLAPRGLPGRWLGWLGLATLASGTVTRPLLGEAWLTVLDVGQGLATVIRTHRHTLVYDTGPRYGPDQDAGSRVVVPFLRWAGINKVDTVVVSHADMDHAGGQDSLKTALPVERWLGSGGEPCIRGDHWEWDGISFQLLHPAPESYFHGNNGSCVLRVEWPGGALLLPGDLAKAGEMNLLANLPQQLPATVLIAPHHGSAGSSTPRFAAAVHPQWVIYSTGYRNRFGFPRSEVVTRYRSLGARDRDTAKEGALTLRLGPNTATDLPSSWRQEARRYWQVTDTP